MEDRTENDGQTYGPKGADVDGSTEVAGGSAERLDKSVREFARKVDPGPMATTSGRICSRACCGSQSWALCTISSG